MPSLKTLLVITINTLLLLVVIEIVSWSMLLPDGQKQPFLLNMKREARVAQERKSDEFTALDPHLGYAHHADEAVVKQLNPKYSWVDGFVVYAGGDPLKRPVILALGGSTTDGVSYGHSWPEELQGLLDSKRIPATVINGGTGGYSTNQELIKLIRDGLSFRPDIVISFSGANDRGKYSELPYPMVNTYQREITQTLLKKNLPFFLPNTIAALQRIVGPGKSAGLRYTYGAKSTLDLAAQYRRNLELMNAISLSQNARFFAFLQPNAYFNSRHEASLKRKHSEDYVIDLLELYKKIISVPGELPYVHDATGIFEQHEGVYTKDGIHATKQGNAIIAAHVLETLVKEQAISPN